MFLSKVRNHFHLVRWESRRVGDRRSEGIGKGVVVTTACRGESKAGSCIANRK
jgi:hypothetical protein